MNLEIFLTLFLFHRAAGVEFAQEINKEGFTKTVMYNPVGEPLLTVTSQDPLTWLGMRSRCYDEHIGYYLSTQFQQLPPEVEALCPAGSLVPFAVMLVDGKFIWDKVNALQHEPLSSLEGSGLNLTFGDKTGVYGALLWPTTELRMVDNETKFTCAVCEMSPRLDAITNGIYPPHNYSIFAYDLELVSYRRIKDVDLVANGSDLTNKLLQDLAEAFNISAKALRWHGATLNGDQKAVVHIYYDPGDVKADWPDYVQWHDQYYDRKTVDNFEVAEIKLSTECLVEKKFLTNVRREMYLTGDLDVKMVNHQLIVRECFLDDVTDTAAWTKPIIWDPVQGPTGYYNKYGSIYSLSGTNFTKELRNNDVDTSINVEDEANGKALIFSIKGFVNYVNDYVLAHKLQRPYARILTLLAYSMPLNFARILMRMPVDDDKTEVLASSPMCSILISDRGAVDPVVGLAITMSDPTKRTPLVVVELHHENTSMYPNTSHIVISVSDSIAFSAKRVAIGTLAAHLDLQNQTNMYDDSIDGWMALVQVVFTRDDPYVGDLTKDFVDIAFKPVFHLPTLKGKCAERNLTSEEWFGDNCRILKSLRDGKVVCRCMNLHSYGNLTNGVYIIYGFDARLSTFLANNMTLVIVLVFVCFMSALGLLSVVLTAVFFDKWRKDQGHQIFLQMTLALTANLGLGFVNNFVIFDTKSVACIGLGVLRHYSFLAMFFWMMVLSGLQVRRLTTIAGAKATTHLILKVSLIAWGLPLIPIVILLAWDTGFYKSEVSNRGYCYPEDVAFQATVQGPAGVILILNLIIFVVILNHIYGWVKCNKDVVVRKHAADDRAAQLRNLGNSIFVFFLFGFTWTFHFLSEEGIINSEFLFEYLFLITASFHLFMLALFFILLDKKTRTLWRNALGCKRKRKLNRVHKPKARGDAFRAGGARSAN